MRWATADICPKGFEGFYLGGDLGYGFGSIKESSLSASTVDELASMRHHHHHHHHSFLLSLFRHHHHHHPQAIVGVPLTNSDHHDIGVRGIDGVLA